MKKRSVISVRVDEETKREAEETLKNMGLNMSVAINLFLRQVIRTGAIPFEVTTEKKVNSDEG